MVHVPDIHKGDSASENVVLVNRRYCVNFIIVHYTKNND